MLVGPDVATAVLGGIRAVVAEPTRDDSLGGRFLAAAAELVYGCPAASASPDLAPESLAACLPDPADARRAAELIAVAALVDGALDPVRLRLALEYAAALCVDDPWTTELELIAAGRMDEAMQLMVVINAATFPGLAAPGEAPDLLPYTGRTDADKKLHARYEALEGFPEESFGRALWAHFRRHGFRLPGVEGAFAESFSIRHDSIHVLSEYDTSIQGEILVSTFTGRMHRTHALGAHLLPVIVQWHVGQEVNGIGAQHGALDPWKFLYAERRGALTSTDVLGPAWDFFIEAERPLAELRTAYGIPELPARFRATGPEVNVTAEADPTAS